MCQLTVSIQIEASDNGCAVLLSYGAVVVPEETLDALLVDEAVAPGVEAGNGRVLGEVFATEEFLLEGLRCSVKFDLHRYQGG